MALTPFALQLLAPHLQGATVLALGYPDLLVSPLYVKKTFGVEVIQTTQFGIGHKAKFDLAETGEVFKALGARSFYCVDIKPSRGVEQQVDLNECLDCGSYSLVIDAGTIEHCANIGQALMNAARAVEVGGRVFHSPPLSMINHGFYNVCPTLLHDFYSQNGWAIEHFSGFTMSGLTGFDIRERTQRFVAPDEAALYFLARRVTDDALKWPVQTKYR